MIKAQSELELAPLFEAVGKALLENREKLNLADLVNANHGDHMIEVFQIAAGAAKDKEGTGLAEAMEYAASLLERQAANGSAQSYSRGLRQIAIQMRKREISLDELIAFVQKNLAEWKPAQGKTLDSQPRSGDVLKDERTKRAYLGR